MAKRVWTPEERRKHAEALQRWKPWAHSTGPKTEDGKAAAAQNALKSGLHTAEIKELKQVLRMQEGFIKYLSS